MKYEINFPLASFYLYLISLCLCSFPLEIKIIYSLYTIVDFINILTIKNDIKIDIISIMYDVLLLLIFLSNILFNLTFKYSIYPFNYFMFIYCLIIIFRLKNYNLNDQKTCYIILFYFLLNIINFSQFK